MNFIERKEMGPIEKYQKFNKFPYKLVVLIILIFLTTTQVFGVVKQSKLHNGNQIMALKTLLFPSLNDENYVLFQNINDFEAHLNNLIPTITNLDQTLMFNVDLSQIKLSFSSFLKSIKTDKTQKMEFPFTLSDTSNIPFDLSSTSSIKEYLNQLQMLQFQAQYINLRFQDKQKDIFHHLVWSFYINYEVKQQVQIKATLQSDSHEVEYYLASSSDNNYSFLHLIIMIFTVISLVLYWKSLYVSFLEFLKHKFKYMNMINKSNIDQSQWNGKIQEHEEADKDQSVLNYNEAIEELSLFDQLKIITLWDIIITLGNMASFIASLLFLCDIFLNNQQSVFNYSETLSGIGCMLTWFVIVKYLNFNHNFSIITKTLNQSSKTLGMFFIGVLPFFFGFVLLCSCFFWQDAHFQDVLASIITLFGMTNGDSITDIFQETKHSGPLGQLLLVIFMILFYTAVQNLFIAIIMEGYEISRQEMKPELQKEKENQNFEQIDILKQESMFKTKLKQITKLVYIKLNGLRKVISQVKSQESSDTQDNIIIQLEEHLISLQRVLYMMIKQQ